MTKTSVEGISFGPKRPGDGVLHRRKASQIGDDRVRVVGVEVRQLLPRHDRREPSSIRPDARRERGDDLFVGPVAEPRRLVRREIAADKSAKTRNRESDIRAREPARKVRFAEEIARRVTVIAARDGHEILAPLDLNSSAQAPWAQTIAAAPARAGISFSSGSPPFRGGPFRLWAGASPRRPLMHELARRAIVGPEAWNQAQFWRPRRWAILVWPQCARPPRPLRGMT